MNSAYLTETGLLDFVRTRIDPTAIHNKPVAAGMKFRPDIHLPKLRMAIEFDGFRHYQQASVVLADIRKEVALAAAGYRTVRIPYFVQLSTHVVGHLFSAVMADYSGYNTYPHGFHDPKALLPSDFCELGVLRFAHDLGRFPDIATAIYDSLYARMKKADARNVLPLSLLSASGHPLSVTELHRVCVRAALRWQMIAAAT